MSKDTYICIIPKHLEDILGSRGWLVGRFPCAFRGTIFRTSIFFNGFSSSNQQSRDGREEEKKSTEVDSISLSRQKKASSQNMLAYKCYYLPWGRRPRTGTHNQMRGQREEKNHFTWGYLVTLHYPCVEPCRSPVVPEQPFFPLRQLIQHRTFTKLATASE